MYKFFLRRIADSLSLSIILEASAYPKPGNVHRTRDRKGLRYEAFLATGVLASKYFEKGIRRGYKGFRNVLIGDLVYGVVREVIDDLKSTNTCLGSSLILSAISVAVGALYIKGELKFENIGRAVREVIENTTVYDSIYYYKAIRKANPSYLKQSDNTGEYVNVWDPFYRRKLLEKNHRLIDVLVYSSKIDLVSDEILNALSRGFEAETFLRSRIIDHGDLNRAIVETYLYMLSRNRDTVVYLKHGIDISKEVSNKAEKILDQVLRSGTEWVDIVSVFDNELQLRGINPGSVADLTAEVIALYLLRNILDKNTLLDLSI
ncbi:MAG: triphosphoribosyl-dephospho-CoA synthase [Desulfurococcaceae archaeon]